MSKIVKRKDLKFGQFFTHFTNNMTFMAIEGIHCGNPVCIEVNEIMLKRHTPEEEYCILVESPELEGWLIQYKAQTL